MTNTTFDYVKKYWNSIAVVGTAVMAIIGGFILSPPIGAVQAKVENVSKFGQFVVTLCCGLILFWALRYRGRRHAPSWWIVSAISFVAGIVAWFLYYHFTIAWTAEYQGQLLVVGSKLASHGQHWMERHPSSTNKDLLSAATGQVDWVWTEDSVQSRIQGLIVMYIACIPLFAISIVGVVQAAYCLTVVSPRTGRKRSGGKPITEARIVR